MEGRGGGKDRCRRGNIKDDSAGILSQPSLQEAFVSSSGMGRDVHSAFSLPTTASPTLQGALKDGFGESVVACDMPEQKIGGQTNTGRQTKQTGK